MTSKHTPLGDLPDSVRHHGQELLASVEQAIRSAYCKGVSDGGSATELLAALRPFVGWLNHIEATGSRRLLDDEWPPASGMPNVGALRKARVAIAKAEGGS